MIEEKTTGLHPTVVLAAVTIARAAFGFLGILLAVPAAMVTTVFVEELWFRRLEEDPRVPKKPG